MKHYTVSLDLRIAVLLDIEADSEDNALDKAWEMRRSELLKLACTDDDAIDIIDGSETVELAP